MADKAQDGLQILSFNCWDLKFSKKRKQRVARLIEWLADTNTIHYDIIGLQEIWLMKDYKKLKESLVTRYPYTAHYKSGFVGSGLVILSKHPIKETFFKRFALCGTPDRFWEGDWFAGKGIAVARVLVGSKTVNFFNCHLHSEYGKTKSYYLAHRITQLQEVSEFVQQISMKETHSIVVGDFNTRPSDFAYQMFVKRRWIDKNEIVLKDGWVTAEERIVGDQEHMTIVPLCTQDTDDEGTVADDESSIANHLTTNEEGDENIHKEHGYTYSRPENTFKGKKPQRLDYILIGNSLLVEQFRVLSNDRVGGENGFSISDHTAISALITFKQRVEAVPEFVPDDHVADVRESIKILSEKRKSLYKWQIFYLVSAIIFFIIFIGLTITTSVTVTNDQLTPLLIIVLYGIQPVVLVTAFMMILMGQLFVRQERTAIEDFISKYKLWMLHYGYDVVELPPGGEEENIQARS